MSHTALANACHVIEQRLARWLVMCHDRVDGDDLSTTHEFLSVMLGVRRAGVSETLQSLEDRGLISATRGRLTVLDRAGLEAAAGDSYGVPEAEYARLFGRALSGAADREPERTLAALRVIHDWKCITASARSQNAYRLVTLGGPATASPDGRNYGVADCRTELMRSGGSRASPRSGPWLLEADHRRGGHIVSSSKPVCVQGAARRSPGSARSKRDARRTCAGCHAAGRPECPSCGAPMPRTFDVLKRLARGITREKVGRARIPLGQKCGDQRLRLRTERHVLPPLLLRVVGRLGDPALRIKVDPLRTSAPLQAAPL